LSLESSHIEVKPGSERSFGFVFAGVFLLIACYPLLSSEPVRWWSIAVTVAILVISLTAPNIFKIPNRLWFKFGMVLGAIVAPIVMALVYIATIAPMGLIARLLGKDLLKSKIDKSAPSYWLERTEEMQPMKNQF
jgi:Saxitoxin biosynthesis operon protein SxtJ